MKQFRILTLVLGLTALFIACGKSADSDKWVETKDVAINAYKSDPENGKQYLDFIYENQTTENITKIKVELITKTGNKTDTIVREVIPETVFKPKDRHLAKRGVGAEPATFDNVTVGRVWYVK